MTRYIFASFVFFYAFALHTTDAARILVIFGMPSKSHTILGNAVVNHLLEAGHEVTYITPILIKNPPLRLHQVDISSNMELIPKDMVNIKNLMAGDKSTHSVNVMTIMFHYITKAAIAHENVQAFINDPNQKFDAVIIEYMFNTMYAGFSEVYKCPLIWFTSIEPMGNSLRLIDEMTNPAYVPELLNTYVPPLTFFERVSQLIHVTYTTIINRIFTYTMDQWAYKQAFGPAAEKRGVELRHISEAELSASLMLSNSHISMGHPVRLPQNCKTIGGYHINNNTQPLSEDLRKVMDNAKHGVIYFSMGSNLNSKDLPDNIKRELLDTFRSFKQTVIWKFEEVLSDLPKNVHILQWAPQQSILAHPNCVLFITHGGLLSTTETIHYGVPIIGIPAFADQFSNIQKAVNKGFAVEVTLNYNLPSNLKVAINEVLNNPRYRNRAKQLSIIYHDRPVSPAKELVHWVEHVIRTDGAPHLRSEALRTPLYQKLYLDLIALIAVVVYGLYRLKKLVFPAKKDKVKKN